MGIRLISESAGIDIVCEESLLAGLVPEENAPPPDIFALMNQMLFRAPSVSRPSDIRFEVNERVAERMRYQAIIDPKARFDHEQETFVGETLWGVPIKMVSDDDEQRANVSVKLALAAGIAADMGMSREEFLHRASQWFDAEAKRVAQG